MPNCLLYLSLSSPCDNQRSPFLQSLSIYTCVCVILPPHISLLSSSLSFFPYLSPPKVSALFSFSFSLFHQTVVRETKVQIHQTLSRLWKKIGISKLLSEAVPPPALPPPPPPPPSLLLLFWEVFILILGFLLLVVKM